MKFKPSFIKDVLIKWNILCFVSFCRCYNHLGLQAAFRKTVTHLLNTQWMTTMFVTQPMSSLGLLNNLYLKEPLSKHIFHIDTALILLITSFMSRKWFWVKQAKFLYWWSSNNISLGTFLMARFRTLTKLCGLTKLTN